MGTSSTKTYEVIEFKDLLESCKELSVEELSLLCEYTNLFDGLPAVEAEALDISELDIPEYKIESRLKAAIAKLRSITKKTTLRVGTPDGEPPGEKEIDRLLNAISRHPS